jgi:phage shock protein A
VALASRFEYLESRIHGLEEELLAQVEVSGALRGLEQEFAELETRREVDAELESLKREVSTG